MSYRTLPHLPLRVESRKLGDPFSSRYTCELGRAESIRTSEERVSAKMKNKSSKSEQRTHEFLARTRAEDSFFTPRASRTACFSARVAGSCVFVHLDQLKSNAETRER